MKAPKRFLFTSLFSILALAAFNQEQKVIPKHEMGFHIGTNLYVPFYIYYPKNTNPVPVRYYPTFDIETGVSFKSRLAKRLKINYGFSFRYYSFFEQYTGGILVGNNIDQVYVQTVGVFSGIGAFNFPLRFNVYGKKLKRYFLIGLDLSIPFFRYHSGSNVYNKSNVYITPAKYLKFDINAPIVVGMGFDIQKKKIALAVEPNIQLTNFIGRYPESALGRKVMISFGVNIMGLNAISSFGQKQSGKK